MDYERLIKKEFKFLKKFGFRTKNYTRNFEIEIEFIRKHIGVGINYVSYGNEIVGCGISVGDKTENLLKNTIFNKYKTAELNRLIAENISSAEAQIKIYAQFVLQNIGEIL